MFESSSSSNAWTPQPPRMIGVETWMPIETEEDRRLRKRNAAIKAIKEKKEYKLYLQGDFALDAVLHEIPEPVTPDPEASSSKRDWERRIMKWRTTLKVATGVIPLQALKNKQFRFVFGRDRPGTKTSSSSTAPTA